MESLTADDNIDESTIDLDRPPHGKGLRRNPCLSCELLKEDKKNCIIICPYKQARLEYLADIESGNSFVEGIVKPMPVPAKAQELSQKNTKPQASKTFDESQKDETMSTAKQLQIKVPPCPKHPDQPQRLNHRDRPTGKCLLCYRENGEKISQARQKKKTAEEPVTDMRLPDNSVDHAAKEPREKEQPTQYGKQSGAQTQKAPVELPDPPAVEQQEPPKAKAKSSSRPAARVYFSEYGEINQWLRESARENMRSVSKEILWHLKQAMRAA
jgi:hypothetical protein